MKSFNHKPLTAFTIVELLIVIVVIGILVTISVLTYSGISSRANVATIQSDLDSNSRKLQLYYSLYNSYPTTLDANKCPSAPTVDANYCLKLSTNNTVNSYSATSSTFTLNIANGSLCYQVTESTTPTNACGNAGTSTYATVTSVTNAANPTSLPSGWVPAEATLAATYYDYSSGGINYRVYVWTSGTGTVTIGTAGLADVLVVGGGGAGGSYYGGGGGGAGGFVQITGATLPSGSNNITVGSGGVAGTTRPYSDQDNGGLSALGYYYSPGGGGGGGDRNGGRSGASGGGAAVSNRPIGSGLAPIGNNGGLGCDTGGNCGGGGGGAGGVGSNAAGTTGGAGGAGTTSTITGSSVIFCAGGGGSGSGAAGLGGSGKGGNGGAGSGGVATAGAVNTGSGGGGKYDSTPITYGGSGGSGVVILRIRL